MRKSSVLVACFCAGLLGGCVFPKKVTIRAVEPARKEIAGIERLAILDMAYEPNSAVGRNVAAFIVAELEQSGAFEIKERSAVDKVLAERELGSAGLGDAALISSIGKTLGVDGVVVGEVTVYDPGKGVGKKASVGVNLRLVSVKTAQVVFSDSYVEHYSKFFEARKKDAILDQLCHDLAIQFATKIAPHYVEREKLLLGALGSERQANSRGIKFASNDLWDKAQEQFEEAIRIAPDSAAAHNNLAVCFERAGKIKEAIEEYETAIRLDPEKDDVQRNLAGARATFRAPITPAKEALEKQRQDVRKEP